MLLSKLGLTVVIPAFNEEEALSITVLELLNALKDANTLELIIVDDGSTDQTKAIAIALCDQYPQLKYIAFDQNQGMGAALRAGFLAATQPWVTFVPSDGQIPADQLLLMLPPIEEGFLLVCTRYSNRKYTPYRWLLSRGLRFLSNLLIGTQIQSDGPYLIDRTLLQALPMLSNSFMLNLELPIRVKRQGKNIKEVTIALRERVAGVSKATKQGRIWHTFLDLWQLRKKLKQSIVSQ
jgi:glycosyltransferase involved in cell wall biosynthesis